jgi:hypothetical protein
VRVSRINTSECTQEATPYQSIGETYQRTLTSGVWSAWSKNWNDKNDGNGGQPPAPKPRSDAGVGQIARAEYSAPNTIAPAGGKWKYLEVDFSTSTIYEGVVSGGGAIVGGIDARNRVFCWRIE